MQKTIVDKPSLLPLDQILPDGQVVNRTWLEQRGFYRSRIDFYLLSGKLVRVGRGAYRRSGPPLKWEHFVYSLQELGIDLHIGGRSA
ncbi:MAG: AbiEi antitoxin N-terminal domain-containing protein, partial [Sulfuricurvum sp.]